MRSLRKIGSAKPSGSNAKRNNWRAQPLRVRRNWLPGLDAALEYAMVPAAWLVRRGLIQLRRKS